MPIKFPTTRFHKTKAPDGSVFNSFDELPPESEGWVDTPAAFEPGYVPPPPDLGAGSFIGNKPVEKFPTWRHNAQGESRLVQDQFALADLDPAVWKDSPAAFAPAEVVQVAPVLRDDGPTLEEYVAAGYKAENYPPAGYAPRRSAPSGPGEANQPSPATPPAPLGPGTATAPPAVPAEDPVTIGARRNAIWGKTIAVLTDEVATIEDQAVLNVMALDEHENPRGERVGVMTLLQDRLEDLLTRPKA